MRVLTTQQFTGCGIFLGFCKIETCARMLAIGCLIVFFNSLSVAQGFLVNYPAEPGAVASSNYTVYVNEVQVPTIRVASNNDVSYAHFGFAGKVTVRIRVSATVSTYNLSPHSYNITSSKAGQDITFELDKPRKLLLNSVNSLVEHLCIIAEPLEESPPKIGDANVTSIMTYSGANNTGGSNNLTIIQNALNNLPSGSILYFPAGRYTAGGAINMVSNKSIYLAPGAVIQASSSAELSFNFNDASNVKLFGRGAIDGLGDAKRPGYDGEGGSTLIAKSDETVSNNCTIDGIILKGAITWTAIVMGTTNWKVNNLKIINGRKFSNHDGWDPHNAVNMMVDNCFFYGTDDCIAFSVTRDNLDLNTTFRNNVFYNDYSGATVRVGPYMGANTRHLNVENNDHLLSGDNDYALGFYIGNSDESSNYSANPVVIVPGSLSKVRYMGNRVENARKGLILMRTQWDDFYSGGNQNGSLDSIAFDKLSAEQVAVGWEGYKSQLEGPTSTRFVNNVSFKDFYQEGSLVTSKTAADMNFAGSYVTNITFGTSTKPQIGITATTLTTVRGSSSPGKFTVTRTGSTSSALTVNYVIHGTAVNGTDYTSISSSVTISSGSSSADITITPSSTAATESYRTVFLSIISNTNSYILGPNYDAVVTIINAGTTTYTQENGTAYRWSGNTNSVSNSNKVAATGLNDGNTSVDVKLNNGSQDVANGYEAAGLTFTSAKTITKVEFINGTYGGAIGDDGCFEADLTVQTTTNGTTWSNATGWTVSPTYVYRSSGVSGTTFTFTGSASNVTGIRISGKVHTDVNNYSWEAYSREIKAFSGTPPGSSSTAYRWSANTTATSNANKVAAPGLNDGNTTTDVKLNGGTNDAANTYEAAGLIFSSAKTIDKVEFINGTYGGTIADNGCFESNLTVQTTTDGTTWTNVSWTLSPSYSYRNSSVSGTTYTFTGTATNILGIRVSGKVHTDANDWSWEAYVREFKAFSGGVAQRVAPTTSTLFENKPVVLYPNPAGSKITLNNITNNSIVSFTDVNGRFIKSQKVNGNTLQIDVSKWANGVYFVHLMNGDKKVIQKFVVAK